MNKYLAIPFLVGFSLSLSAFGARAPLDGTWLSNCYTEQNETTYAKDSMTFDGNNLDLLVTDFADSQCATQSFAAEVKATYQDGAHSITVPDATEVDETVTSIGLVFYAPNLIATLNEMKLCGYSDWAVGQMKDVTGKTCNNQEMPKQGDRSYDIYEILSDKTLVTGMVTKDYDGSTPEKRPQALDMSKQYSKQ